MINIIKKSFFPVILIFIFFIITRLAFAANPGVITANGSGTSYAQFSEATVGAVNFMPSGNSISVSSSALTGHAWGEGIGWINLAPTNAGVFNNCAGDLSGYAWGENTGYINFNPTNGGVTVSPANGEFDGWAWSHNYGWLKFECPGTACVQSNWTCSTSSRKQKPLTAPEEEEEEEEEGGVTFLVSQIFVNQTSKQAIIVITRTGAIEEAGSANIIVSGGTASLGVDYIDPSQQLSWGVGESGSKTIIIQFTDTAFSVEGKSLVLKLTDLNNLIAGTHAEMTIFIVKEEVPPILPPEIPEVPEIPEPEVPGPEATEKPSKPVEPTEPVRSVEPDKEPPKPLEIFNIEIGIPGVSAETTENVLQTVVVAGLILGLFGVSSVVATNVGTFAELGVRLWSVVFTLFVPPKRQWGVVFDSETKEPIDPAHIIVYNQTGEQVTTGITDIHGRYGFLLDPGFYKLVVSKTNYIFPSLKLVGQNSDGLYDNLYFGGLFEIKGGEIVDMNIPMDAIARDWNQEAKDAKSPSRGWNILRSISFSLFFVGLVVSIILAITSPGALNFIILGIYIIALFFYLGLGRKSFGIVTDKQTDEPLSFAIVRVFNATLGVEVNKGICDAKGHYHILVPKGKVYVTVEKKNPDGSYTHIYTSEVFPSKKVVTKDLSV